jgi:hypothetical protein
VSGGEALSFVQQRKNLARGDLDRIVRPQAFLSSAVNAVFSAGTMTSPSTLGRLVDAVHRSIVLDTGLDLLDFAQHVKGMASGDMTFATIPVVNINGRSEDGQRASSRWTPSRLGSSSPAWPAGDRHPAALPAVVAAAPAGRPRGRRPASLASTGWSGGMLAVRGTEVLACGNEYHRAASAPFAGDIARPPADHAL